MWRIETLHAAPPSTKLPQWRGLVVPISIISIYLFQVEDEQKQKLIFTDRVKVKHGFIIIEHPPGSGKCLVSWTLLVFFCLKLFLTLEQKGFVNFVQVVAAKGQWREKYRWIAHKGWKDRKNTTYDPARIRLEAEDSEWKQAVQNCKNCKKLLSYQSTCEETHYLWLPLNLQENAMNRRTVQFSFLIFLNTWGALSTFQHFLHCHWKFSNFELKYKFYLR